MACTETITVRCPDCASEDIKRNGKSNIHQQQYDCKHCKRSFQRHYQRKAWTPKVRNMIVAMTMSNSGIRDIEDVLDIHRHNVMAAIQRAAYAIPTAQVSQSTRGRHGGIG
jgi:insertion element IS1 protein InsB